MRRGHGQEDGVLAIVLALALALFLSLAVALVVQVGWTGTGFTAFQRQQSQALDAADGALNLAVGTIRQSTTLPCTLPSNSFSTSPVSSTGSVAVYYYSSYPPSGSPLSCTQGTGPASTPQSALLVATGTAGKSLQAAQYLEDELEFTSQVTGGVFTDAVFSYQNMNLQQSMTIHSSTDSADVYVANSSGGTGLTCANSSTVYGNVTVEGPFTAESSCVVEGNVYAWNLYLQDSAEIEGYASANDTPCSGSNLQNTLQNGNSVGEPPGTMTLNNSAEVVGTAYACGSITTNNSSSVGKKLANDNSPPASPDGAETFPSVPESSTSLAAWTAAGWTVNQTYSSCPGTNPFLDGLPAYSGNTLFVTNCPVQDFNSNQISLSANVAILSTGGFWFQDSSSWTSTSSTTRDVYLMVPSSVNGTATTCSTVPSGSYHSNSPPPSNPNIVTMSSASFASSLDVLLYTPCTLQMGASSVGTGQIYGGQVSVSNSVSFTYAAPPQPPGVSGGGSTQTQTESLVFERQLASAPSL